jgi:hypothetical protein
MLRYRNHLGSSTCAYHWNNLNAHAYCLVLVKFLLSGNFFPKSLLFHQLFTPFMVTILHVSRFRLHSYIWFVVVHVSPLVQFGKFRCTYAAFYGFHSSNWSSMTFYTRCSKGKWVVEVNRICPQTIWMR